MKMNQEVDAMQVMGVDPIARLIAPRMLALMIIAPMLLVAIVAVAMLVALTVSVCQFGLSSGGFWSSFGAFSAPSDLAFAVLKAETGAMIVGLVAGLRGLDDLAVAGRVHDDRHGRVVLRGRAHHGRPADVDLLDDGVLRGARVHGVHERVEVHDDEVERLHLELAQLGHVVLTTTVGQDARVHARVQRLHAAVQALLEPGDLGDLGDGHAGGGDALGGGAGRDDLHARGVEPGGELLEAGLVVHGDQGPLQGHRVQDGGD